MAYIYKITNDINNKVYIGKTERSIEKRFREHCSDAFSERKENRPLYAAMRKYGAKHFRVEQLEETNNPEEREIYWIEQYDSYSKGYNATLGGDGKRYIDYDKVVEEYLECHNQALVADRLKISPDSVHNILSARNIPIKSSPLVAKENFGKAVNMYDKAGNFIGTFETMRDAGRFLIENEYSHCKLSTIRQHISEVCRGSRKTAAGFVWREAIKI